MPQAGNHESARRHAEVRYGFLVHAAVYAAVMVLLVVIDLLASPGTLWFHWPLVGWGLGLALHGARVFLFGGGNTIVDALTEHELRRADAAKRDEGGSREDRPR